ncbi:LysR family transcriptional regulator [Roseomonas xinghualingensis]|uniref:LysR family transcriptional regulator n=1 Tax=Roseomonas xinghualingensis TaxID=2986475 RepID=UPI0021F1F1F0|nr:LysR family transcriptional regulator [Roseomonas sp. SXEYE001]MCV4209258.1 LysR family transcriptional regulator [Roseomonas sp. SXEYE001]
MASPSLTLRQLRTYLTVVESGSVSTAARLLGMTQPAASQQLREMERRTGIRLLERAAGRSLPTAAGHALIAPARRALTAAEDVEAVAATHREGQAGRIRLGTGATACIHLLPPVLATVRRRLPAVELIVATGNTPDIVRRVEEGDLDIALVTLPVPPSRSLLVTPLLTDALVAMLPTASAPDGTGAIGASALARLPLILYEPGGTMRGLVDAWFARAGVKPHLAMELGNIEAIKGLVGSGLGGSVLPALSIGAEVPGTVWRPLRPALSRRLGIILRREKTRDRGLRVLVEELEQLARR